MVLSIISVIHQSRSKFLSAHTRRAYQHPPHPPVPFGHSAVQQQVGLRLVLEFHFFDVLAEVERVPDVPAAGDERRRRVSGQRRVQLGERRRRRRRRGLHDDVGRKRRERVEIVRAQLPADSPEFCALCRPDGHRHVLQLLRGAVPLRRRVGRSRVRLRARPFVGQQRQRHDRGSHGKCHFIF